MLNSTCDVIKVKNEETLKIVSYEIEYGIFENEVLLSLEIDPLYIGGPNSDIIEKQILELHFDQESKEYICSMIYGLDKFGSSDDGRYRSLNKREMEVINNFIKEKELDFSI